MVEARGQEYSLKLDYVNAFGASFVTREHVLRNSLMFLDEQRIMYPIGQHIAIRDYETGKINFLFMPDSVMHITCMKLSPNKKYLLLTVQLRADPTQCFLQIYSFKEEVPKAHRLEINLSALADNKLL
jgi:hypothetical protein